VTGDNGVAADAIPANARVDSDSDRSSPPVVRTLIPRNVFMISRPSRRIIAEPVKASATMTVEFLGWRGILFRSDELLAMV
jgi:hypothetical protein